MYNHIKEKEYVENFLEELREILTNKKSKLDIIQTVKNTETLLELNYNSEDIKKELLNLKIQEYVESVLDTKDGTTLNVFSKIIKSQQVYIKIKIRSKENKTVLCLSFHFAEYKIDYFPYK